jgi:hypothetical protein
MGKGKRKQAEVICLDKARYWRDEMNLAEFPLASLGSTAAADELTFTDTVFDRGTRKSVTRTITVSPSKSYGLPTAMDEEVLLALIQLSAKREFAEPKVHFTRYELIRELGWDGSMKSYKRIDKSLRRWTGVTVHYDNAWWNKAEQCWVSEHFHIIESATILDRERRDRRLKQDNSDANAGKSSIVWSEALFSSFQAGNLKKLDFAFFRSLDRPVAKRLYRFLDKRFHHQPTFGADLRDFACEKVGLSKNFSNSKLKERLSAGIRELEEKGFLEPLAEEERFQRISHGQWRVCLRKAEPPRRKRATSTKAPKVMWGMDEASPKKRPEVMSYLASLTKAEREKCEKVAAASAAPGLRSLLRGLDPKTQAYRLTLDRVVAEYVLLRLGAAV